MTCEHEWVQSASCVGGTQFERWFTCIKCGAGTPKTTGNDWPASPDNEAAFDQLLHNPRELAQQDADAFGIGYVVDGQRVAPHRVQLFVPAAKTTGTAGELPPLPAPKEFDDPNWHIKYFTADQMREYGQACAEAAAHKVWCAEVNCDAVREELAELKAARQPAQAPVREGQDRGIELAFMGVPPGRCLHEFDCDFAGVHWSIWRCRHCGTERRR